MSHLGVCLLVNFELHFLYRDVSQLLHNHLHELGLERLVDFAVDHQQQRDGIGCPRRC